MLRLSLKYFKRVMDLPSNQLVKAAMTEQVNLRLSWYTGIEGVIKHFNDIDPRSLVRNSSLLLNATSLADASNPEVLASNLQKRFVESWRSKIECSRKLTFYKEVKSAFTWEPYLDHASTFDDIRSTAQIRCSSHKLSIETGRYNNTSIENRICIYCELNGCVKVTEDEIHFLTSCPQGKESRDKFKRSSESMLSNDDNGPADIISILTPNLD